VSGENHAPGHSPAVPAGVRPFVLLFEARSGSSWVTEILERHPLLEVEFEPLAAFPAGVHGKVKEGNLADAESLASGQLRAARAGLTRSTGASVAVGFNTKLSDVLDVPAFGSLLREVRARVILLTRRNLVKQTVSLFRGEELAHATGDWNLYRDSDRPPAFPIDPDLFDDWLRTTVLERTRLQQFVLRLELPTLRRRARHAYASPLDFARAYAQLGDADKTFDYLDQALAEHSPGLVLLNVDRAWDAVRADPRFNAAVRRVGLPS